MNNRYLPFDILRIISSYAVILIHFSGQNMNESFPSNEWIIRSLYDSSAQWSVPIFVMISGALFLDSSKTIGINKLYKKYIPRNVFVYCIWSLIYACQDFNNHHNYKLLWDAIIVGKYHLWFLKMIIGLYIIVPLLKIITTDKNCELYFIIIAIITAFVIPYSVLQIENLSIIIAEYVESIFTSLEIKIALGYSGYFLMGHYLKTYSLSSQTKMVIYIMGGVSFIAVPVLIYYESLINGHPVSTYFDFLNPFIMIEAISLFVFVTTFTHVLSHTKMVKIIVLLSKYSLGIYLVHILIMGKVNYLCGMDSSSFNLIIFIPIFSLLVFTLSLLFSMIVSKIPYLRKIMI